MAYKNKYPFVLVHGMMGWGEEEGLYAKFPYWGMSSGNLAEKLRAEGLEVYAPQVSPIGGAWDRACELYALLTGTKVDYGKAHSAEKKHDRFGRTYAQPLFPGWGSTLPDGGIKKVHLLGHSFGGATIRILTELLENGCQAEKDVTDPGDLSPLFEGGHGGLVATITTLASPHDGTTFVHVLAPFMTVVKGFSSLVGALLADVGLLSFYDIHMEQFGLNDMPGTSKGRHLHIAKRLGALKSILKSKDNVYDDLRIDQAYELNKHIHCSKDTYYFSVATDGTRPSLRNPENHVPAPIMAVTFLPSALLMGRCREQTIGNVHVDASWHANDGLVPTESALYPHQEPFIMMRDAAGKYEKGIWNVYAPFVGDHGTIVGGSKSYMGKRSKNFLKYVNKHLDLLMSLED